MSINYAAPFLLIQQTGEVLEFADLASLASACVSARIRISVYHDVDEHWIVRDDWGQIVPPAALWNARPVSGIHYFEHRAALVQMASVRKLPIPFAGRRRRLYGRGLRHPRHHGVYQQIGADAAARNEFRVTGKIKRPPNNWDDLLRHDQDNRNWKQQRKTQWKN